jgi:type II restriction enzyme
MATNKQELGNFGEEFVAKSIACPSCKSLEKTLKLLPQNFKCADLICDFCGYLAQVKSVTVKDIDLLPQKILGAAWKPQKERMDSGIYFPLFIVAYKDKKNVSVYFLPSDLQTTKMFTPRKPLSESARRAGWQGFMIDLSLGLSAPTKLI